MDPLDEHLRSNVDRIVDEWVAELKKSPPTNIHRRLGTRKTVANIPALLHAMIPALVVVGIEAQRGLLREASHLGELRQAQGLRIGDLVKEYAVLRSQIWRLLAQGLRDKKEDMWEVGGQIGRLLDLALEASVEAFHDIERGDLLERSSLDSLTGLYNHAHFWQRLDHEVARATRYNHTVAVLMIDIDDFKSYNDLYGHLSGDLALVEIAGVLEKERRSADIVARYGGEEFAVILPETGGPGAHVAADRIRKAIAAHSFQPIGTRYVPLTVSIGCAANEEGPVSPRALVEAADTAMYEAKREGKNRIRAYVLRSGQRTRLS